MDKPVPSANIQLEKNTKDKLSIFQDLESSKKYYKGLCEQQVRSFYGVDREIAQTFRALEITGQLGRTAVIFTSDNGYSLGENGGKARPLRIHLQ